MEASGLHQQVLDEAGEKMKKNLEFMAQETKDGYDKMISDTE